MRKLLLTLSGILLIYSCSSLQKSPEISTSNLVLGTVVLKESTFTGKHLKSIGQPSLVGSLPVAVGEYAFTGASYKKHLKNKGSAAKQSTVKYHDSLQQKPTYFKLELGDQIELQQLLNVDENKDFRTYVARNENYAIVYNVSLTVSETARAIYNSAEAVFLTETESGLALTFLENGSLVSIPFPKENVFDYELCSFCWGEGRYNEKRVEAIVNYKSRCPEGTVRNGNELDGTKDYLKL